jgi:ribonuclease HI
MYTLQFDGLFHEVHSEHGRLTKTGFLCYGWLIYKNDKIIAHGYGGFAQRHYATSNIAEYLALIEGLEALKDMGAGNEKIKVLGDSKTVIEQMKGSASINCPNMKKMQQRASNICRTLRITDWNWIPRRQNRQADQLTRVAMRQIRGNTQDYRNTIKSLTDTSRASRRNHRMQPLVDLRIYQPASAFA